MEEMNINNNQNEHMVSKDTSAQSVPDDGTSRDICGTMVPAAALQDRQEFYHEIYEDLRRRKR